PSLLARIEQAATATPDAVALVSGTEKVSYRELWTRAGELAGALAAAGVEPGHLVGVSLPRGSDLIVALLATWRAGAGYVPIDPRLPALRQETLVDQAAVAAVVTPGGVTPGAATPTRVDEPAYVLFTSGSTGAPKPVLVGRAALAARTGWM